MAAVQIIFDIFMMFGLNEFDVNTMNNEKGEKASLRIYRKSCKKTHKGKITFCCMFCHSFFCR